MVSFSTILPNKTAELLLSGEPPVVFCDDNCGFTSRGFSSIAFWHHFSPSSDQLPALTLQSFSNFVS